MSSIGIVVRASLVASFSCLTCACGAAAPRTESSAAVAVSPTAEAPPTSEATPPTEIAPTSEAALTDAQRERLDELLEQPLCCASAPSTTTEPQPFVEVPNRPAMTDVRAATGAIQEAAGPCGVEPGARARCTLLGPEGRIASVELQGALDSVESCIMQRVGALTFPRFREREFVFVVPMAPP